MQRSTDRRALASVHAAGSETAGARAAVQAAPVEAALADRAGTATMGPRPAYAQVRDWIKNALLEGRWAPGALMPSEAELVGEFGVSRMTVNRALRELQEAGLIERLQGVGTFAARQHKLSSRLAIRDLREEIAERGHRHHLQVLLARAERATRPVAQRLGLEPGEPVFHSRVVHFDDGLAIQCEDRYVNPRIAPDFLSVDFERTTPTHYLLQVAPVWEMDYSIMAGSPTPFEARALGIAEQEPCLIVLRRTLTKGVPVTWVRLAHPGNRYQIDGVYSP